MKMGRLISPGLRNKQFYLLCLSSGLFFASFNMIIPELPNYLTSLGGADYKGLIISLFAITAAISRPFSGKLADLVGRKPIMIFGAAASAICGAMYPFVTGLMGFFILRLLHGLATGFKPTGDTAYLADIVNSKNRGEALGILGMSGSTGMAAGPAIGSLIAMHYDLNTMFALSSLMGFLSIVIIIGMKESVNTTKFKTKMLKIDMGDVLETRVLAPSIVMLLAVFSFGMALTIIPDFSTFIGIENKGLFFTITLAASIIARMFSGRASDRIGRVKMLKFGMATLAISMAIVGASTTPTMFMIGGVVYGISAGINSPTVFAWTVDLASPEKRGRAMATLFISLEIGILLGALVSAEIYNNNSDYFKYAFWSGTILAIVGFLILHFKISEKSLR